MIVIILYYDKYNTYNIMIVIILYFDNYNTYNIMTIIIPTLFW